MEAYFQPSDQGSWRGRRRLTLPLVLDADLQTLSSGYRLQRALTSTFSACARTTEKVGKKLTDGLLFTLRQPDSDREKRGIVENIRDNPTHAEVEPLRWLDSTRNAFAIQYNI
ncbi:hypothetical protein F441_20120 [Phytophthora nicotianae CJ01A1]|uniref:Uncharacterized protein n=1 Tax=Phytophthora nicotianae CJ01A1 TaxID=1317063 RepID=W2VZP5_PHYNI|nr:hypothetical protein F441_20120 [Phytophthora nicotianae CJ01A1]